MARRQQVDVPLIQLRTVTAPVGTAPPVITDFGAEPAAVAAAVPGPQSGRSPSASACGPHQKAIELGLSRGRNAMAIW